MELLKDNRAPTDVHGMWADLSKANKVIELNKHASEGAVLASLTSAGINWPGPTTDGAFEWIEKSWPNTKATRDQSHDHSDQHRKLESQARSAI